MFNRPLSRMPTSSLAHNDGWRWLDRGQLLPLPIYWPLTAPINRLLCLLGSWSTRLLNNVMTPFIIPTPHILECPTCQPARFSQDYSHLFLRNKNTRVSISTADGDGDHEKSHDTCERMNVGTNETISIVCDWLCVGQIPCGWEKRWYLWWGAQGCGRSWPWHCRRCHITSH